MIKLDTTTKKGEETLIVAMAPLPYGDDPVEGEPLAGFVEVAVVGGEDETALPSALFCDDQFVKVLTCDGMD